MQCIEPKRKLNTPANAIPIEYWKKILIAEGITTERDYAALNEKVNELIAAGGTICR